MAEPIHFSPAAFSYARAILELAEERKQPIDALAGELRELCDGVGSDPAIGHYLSDPSISADSRGKVLDGALRNRVSPLVLDFVGLLNSKGRLRLFPEVVGAFQLLVDRKLGKVEVDLIVAHKLTPDEIEQARKMLSSALKRDAVVHTYVDEEIIGGAVIRVGDQMIDGSVRAQLSAMKEKILASRPQKI